VRGQRRIAAIAVATLCLAACGGPGKGDAKSEASAHGARPLAVRADGTLDPERIDLGGVAGVTHDEQVSAEDLLRRTILALPKWSDVAQAKTDGFASIGDKSSGSEHYVHWDWINDNVILDPSRPESLVYRVEPNGGRILEAAMFILPKRYRLDNTPDVGGKLTQFHIHDILCFSNSRAPQYRRLTRADGSCIPPFVKLLTTPMIHVWIRPNPCGAFAPIGGFASGTIRNGERVACDSAHGSAFNF
jgi:hypothetical protein